MSTVEQSDWDALSFTLSSHYRVGTVASLADAPNTPTKVSDDTGIATAHVSRALQELADEELVELLVSEDRKKGRIYGLTERGETVADMLDERGEL